MNSAKDNIYLIAANVFDQMKSRILEIILEASNNECHEWDPAVFDASTIRLIDTMKARFDLTEFIGGGYEIVVCRKIDKPEEECTVNEYEDIVALGRAEKREIFDVLITIEEFPLIEGSFVPGIYQISEMETTYCTVDDLMDLSESFINSDVGFITKEYKLVCFPDKIEMRLIAENELIEEKPWHPFTFFDFSCPFCHQKVLGCWSRLVGERDCDVIKNLCPHFIGYLVRVYGDYEEPALKDLGVNYKYEGKDLYFEVAPGQWQMPYIIIPPVDPINSYWNYHGDTTIQDEMLFFEAL